MVANADQDYIVTQLEIAKDALGKAASRLNRLGARELRDEVHMLIEENARQNVQPGAGLNLILGDARELE